MLIRITVYNPSSGNKWKLETNKTMKTIIYDKRNNKYYRTVGYRYPKMGGYYVALSGTVVYRRSEHQTNSSRLIPKEVTRKVTTEFQDVPTLEFNGGTQLRSPFTYKSPNENWYTS